jgi:ribosomal-protein-alanine N-acetyltransferase
MMAQIPIRMIPIDTVLETERCCLRYPNPSDANRAFSAFISPFFPKLLPLGQINSLQETKNWILQSQNRWAEGLSYTWSIERRSDGLMVGQVTLAKLPDEERWSLAFWIHPENWGQGFATEAASEVLRFAFTKLNLDTVWAATGMWNQASVSVLIKLGMTHIADNPEGYTIKDRSIPTHEYEISRYQWDKEQITE